MGSNIRYPFVWFWNKIPWLSCHRAFGEPSAGTSLVVYVSSRRKVNIIIFVKYSVFKIHAWNLTYSHKPLYTSIQHDTLFLEAPTKTSNPRNTLTCSHFLIYLALISIISPLRLLFFLIPYSITEEISNLLFNWTTNVVLFHNRQPSTFHFSTRVIKSNKTCKYNTPDLWLNL